MGGVYGVQERSEALWGLWDIQEVGKSQGFMRYMGVRSTLDPKGAQRHPESGRISGSPQKLMPEPRPVAPPLL